MKGRKPKPDHLKLVEGTTRKRKRGSRKAVETTTPGPRVLPSPPAHLSPEARVHWGWYSAQLDRMGVLTEEHAHGLEQLCCLYQEMIELREAVKLAGRTYSTTNRDGATMIRPHPLVAMLADCDRRYRGWENEYGLTPASRPRVPGERQADSDPGEKHFA